MQYGQDVNVIDKDGSKWYYLEDLETKQFSEKINGNDNFSTTMNAKILFTTVQKSFIGGC